MQRKKQEPGAQASTEQARQTAETGAKPAHVTDARRKELVAELLKIERHLTAHDEDRREYLAGWKATRESLLRERRLVFQELNGEGRQLPLEGVE